MHSPFRSLPTAASGAGGTGAEDGLAGALAHLDERCHAVAARLIAAFGWRLDGPALAAFVRRAAQLASEALPAWVEDECGGRPVDADRFDTWLERQICRLHFAEMYDALHRGGDERTAALAELFEPRWHTSRAASAYAAHDAALAEDSGGPAVTVTYHGYAFRAAFQLLQRKQPWPAGGGGGALDTVELAATAAARAVARIQARLGECRARDAFWGWMARIVERAAIDELRAALRHRRAAAVVEPLPDESLLPSSADEDEAVIDALSLRRELLHKFQTGRLQRHHLLVLVAIFWEGQSIAAVAEQLNSTTPPLPRRHPLTPSPSPTRGEGSERAAPPLPLRSPSAPTPPLPLWERGSGGEGNEVTPAQVSQWKYRALRVLRRNLEEAGFSP